MFSLHRNNPGSSLRARERERDSAPIAHQIFQGCLLVSSDAHQLLAPAGARGNSLTLSVFWPKQTKTRLHNHYIPRQLPRRGLARLTPVCLNANFVALPERRSYKRRPREEAHAQGSTRPGGKEGGFSWMGNSSRARGGGADNEHGADKEQRVCGCWGRITLDA